MDLSPDECRALAPLLAAGAELARRDGSALPAELAELAGRIRAAGGLDDSRLTARAAAAGSRHAGEVPRLVADGSAAASCGWLTTRQAAELVGITPRAILKARARGRLTGRREAGSTVWEIDAASALELRDARHRRAGNDDDSRRPRRGAA